MARIVKKADERKEELLDIAIALFLANGYVNTSVSDILMDKSKSYALRYSLVFKHWQDLINGRYRVRGTEHDAAVFRLLSEKMLSGIFSEAIHLICLLLGADEGVFRAEAER